VYSDVIAIERAHLDIKGDQKRIQIYRGEGWTIDISQFGNDDKVGNRKFNTLENQLSREI